eukprot:COSAG01_NODE_3366_length_6190_cov_7.861763_2_plen_68_part_00
MDARMHAEHVLHRLARTPARRALMQVSRHIRETPTCHWAWHQVASVKGPAAAVLSSSYPLETPPDEI